VGFGSRNQVWVIFRSWRRETCQSWEVLVGKQDHDYNPLNSTHVEFMDQEDSCQGASDDR